MRILQLGKFYPIGGGVEKVMKDLTEGLSSRGIHCDMLCASLDGEQVIQLNSRGRIICKKAWLKAAGTMIAPGMISYLRKHCREYDLIHVHHPDPMAALALRLSGYQGRVILHWHSDIISQKEFFILYKPLQNWLVKRAQRIVGTTPVYVEESPHLAAVQHKCTYVPIGIEPVVPDKEAAMAERKKYPGRLILSIGRLVPYKGYSYLIDAMSLLPEYYHLVIGGSGPLQKQFQEQIGVLGLEERVTLLGRVPEAQKQALFGACDVFVLPSVIKTEAFGIVQIEAMSCGKPVVATRIPASGVSWVNVDGVSGVNVTYKNSVALAAGIEKAYERKEEYGEGARALFLERYTLAQMINKTIRIYENEC